MRYSSNAPYYYHQQRRGDGDGDGDKSHGIPTGESTIATRHDIGLTPGSSKTNNKERYMMTATKAGTGTGTSAITHQLQPPKAISIRSPQHSPNNSSRSGGSQSHSESEASYDDVDHDDDVDEDDFRGVEEGVTASESTTSSSAAEEAASKSSSGTSGTTFHHQYEVRDQPPPPPQYSSPRAMQAAEMEEMENSATNAAAAATGIITGTGAAASPIRFSSNRDDGHVVVVGMAKSTPVSKKSQQQVSSSASSSHSYIPEHLQRQQRLQKQQQQKPALDLKRNDNSFYVIASLVVDRFSDKLRTDRFVLSASDKDHLDRVVPRKYDFIDALQFRLSNSLREDSLQPIHVITKQCRALGLHRTEGGGHNGGNPLLAAIGSTIVISSDEASIATNLTSVQSSRPHGPDELARQQLLAELREASTLMAQSVTPEASQFWRKHVVELQAKLRALQKADAQESSSSPMNKDRETMTNKINQDGDYLSTLWQNTGYVPPSQDEMTAVSNTIGASRAPAVSHNNVNNSDPSDMELPMIDVVAPADLPAGYQFEAAIDNNVFIATVPMGGVRQGQTFSCYMKDVKKAGIPFGHWRDGFFDVFKFGGKHPMVLNSFFLPLLALAQIQTRVGLDFTGQRLDSDDRRRGTWSPRGMMSCVMFVWLGLNAMIIYGLEWKLHNFLFLSAADIFSLVLVNGSFIVFSIYVAANTRTFLQEKYQIDRQNTTAQLRGQNIILSTFCLPLVIAQMGRHTASYDEYDGVCLSDTGIPKEDADDDSAGGVV